MSTQASSAAREGRELRDKAAASALSLELGDIWTAAVSGVDSGALWPDLPFSPHPHAPDL